MSRFNKKKGFNPEKLNEEISRFNLINEYSFYVGEDDSEVEGLILGEDEEEIEDVEQEGQEEYSEEELGQEPEQNIEPDMEQDFEQTDEVELDVTDLVQGTEEAKESADSASKNIEILMNKFNELEGKLSDMDNIIVKIDSLQDEIEKRNPTPTEKIEMRSFNSYPYNMKLTDFWDEKDPDKYEVMDDNSKEEYSINKEDLKKEYSEIDIRNSFSE